MLEIEFVGPKLEAGPLPAIFYFALSAKDSLFLDPFNQPVVALQNKNVRIFSVTLPGHDILPATTALEYWADEFKNGNNPLDPFIAEVAAAIENFKAQNVITDCGVMGLSRGVFIAAHVAAALESVSAILGFAPLVKLSSITEFQGMDMAQWDLDQLAGKLYRKTIRCYMGNRDVRTGTDLCFSWLHDLTNTAFEKGLRSAPIEFIMTPSIGRDGHGTSPEVFRAGALWLASQLKVSDAT